jgi:hypothetical protein
MDSEFKSPAPIRPNDLPQIAVEILDALAKQPLASEIVIGGGIALKHYANYRPTQDIDAWWKSAGNPEASNQIRAAMEMVASSLTRIENQRPLESIPTSERAEAAKKRAWFRDVFLHPEGRESR